MKVTARKERETGSGLLRAALSKLIEIPLIWKRKREPEAGGCTV
jgi:hypothetical protein